MLQVEATNAAVDSSEQHAIAFLEGDNSFMEAMLTIADLPADVRISRL